MCRLLWAVALVSASTVTFAQNGKRPVTLEAAAVKAAPPDMPPLVPGNWAPPTSSSARLRPMTLRTLVMYAFDSVPWRHDPEPVGGPAWFDKTAYQLLWWVPVRSGGIVPDAADVMMLGTAVQEQLGLNLEPRREPRDVIVIESAEMPVLD